MTRCFGLHSNFLGADEIKGFPYSIYFPNRNTELLLLFSVILHEENKEARHSLKNLDHTNKISYTFLQYCFLT